MPVCPCPPDTPAAAPEPVRSPLPDSPTEGTTITLRWSILRDPEQDSHLAHGTGAHYLVIAQPGGFALLYALHPMSPACPPTADAVLRLAFGVNAEAAQALAQDWENRFVETVAAVLA